MLSFGSNGNIGVCVGGVGGKMCLRWCWHCWCDEGLCVLALTLIEVGGIHVGVMDLCGIVVGGDGLALSLACVMASRSDGGGRHWRWYWR